MTRVLLVVIGCHRSGTSATAGVLSHLGVDFGSPERLMPPSSHNPKGYYENLQIVHTHDWLLKALGRGWSDCRPFPQPPSRMQLLRARAAVVTELMNHYTGDVIGVKDPRATLLYPLWQEVAHHLQMDLACISVTRDMEAIVQSLLRREDWDGQEDDVRALVLRYMQGALEWRTNVPRMQGVAYERLLDNWLHELGNAVQALGLMPDLPYDTARADAVDAFLDRGLDHAE